jgi:multiple sugar transport system ATP-binding protein
MRVELATLHRRLGATMIYVTHDQVEAMTLADKIVVLNKGRIEQVGRPLDLYNKPASLFVAGFIGSPQINFLPQEFAQSYGATTVGIRPEHFRVEAGGVIKGTLKHAEKLGNETFAYINAGVLGDITARIDGTLAMEPGNTIELGFEQQHIYKFDSSGKRIG